MLLDKDKKDLPKKPVLKERVFLTKDLEEELISLMNRQTKASKKKLEEDRKSQENTPDNMEKFLCLIGSPEKTSKYTMPEQQQRLSNKIEILKVGILISINQLSKETKETYIETLCSLIEEYF